MWLKTPDIFIKSKGRKEMRCPKCGYTKEEDEFVSCECCDLQLCTECIDWCDLCETYLCVDCYREHDCEDE